MLHKPYIRHIPCSFFRMNGLYTLFLFVPIFLSQDLQWAPRRAASTGSGDYGGGLLITQLDGGSSLFQINDTCFGGFIKFDTQHHRNLRVISGSSGAPTFPRSWCLGPSGRLVEVGRKRPGHQSPPVWEEHPEVAT